MSEATVLHQRKRRMERDGLGNVSGFFRRETDKVCDLSGSDATVYTPRVEVAAMNDKEKIAKAVGMLEVAKAICMNKTFSNEAVMVATALQITVDAVMSVLKDDD